MGPIHPINILRESLIGLGLYSPPVSTSAAGLVVSRCDDVMDVCKCHLFYPVIFLLNLFLLPFCFNVASF